MFLPGAFGAALRDFTNFLTEVLHQGFHGLAISAEIPAIRVNFRHKFRQNLDVPYQRLRANYGLNRAKSIYLAFTHWIYAQFNAVNLAVITYLSPMSQSPKKAAPDQSLVRESGYEGRGLAFIVDEAPDSGSATEIAPGVFWLRFPLPMSGLDHINLWALRDGDGWVIVDTGIADKVSRGIWERHFTKL